MRIYFHCPNCRRALSDLATQAGKDAICPNCKTEILVPVSSEIAPPTLEICKDGLAFFTGVPTKADPLPGEGLPKPAVRTDKSNPFGPSPSLAKASRRQSRNKAWAYAFSAIYLLVVALVIAGAIASRGERQRDDTLASQAKIPEEVNQATPPDSDTTALAMDNSTESKPAVDKENLAADDDEPVIAKVDVNRKDQTHVNAPVDRTKPAAKIEVVDQQKSYAALVVKRRQTKSEEELRKDLAWVKEIGLGASASAVLANWGKWIRGSLAGDSHQESRLINLKHATPIVNTRPDLGGLPFRQGSSCQIKAKDARTLAQLGPKLKQYLNAAAPLDLEGHRPGDLTLLRETLRLEMHGKRPEWLRYEAIPAMMQILMHEDKPLRQILVDMLSEIPEKQATVALAQRAVFDLAPEVRESALLALKKRMPEDYLPVFLKALRYPTPAFSDHAAEALAALRGQDAKVISQLVVMLAEPDPLSPVSVGSRGGFQREVVRAKHVTNCLLCHAPAVTATDEGVIGADPVQTIRSQGGSGASPSFWGGGGGGSGVTKGPTQPLLIRADIAFIRQDFSVSQPELQAGTTLTSQSRFDYMVRLRYLPEKKAREFQKKFENEDTYPQRESVLFALRELTGQDAGSTTEAWQKQFPRAELDVEAAKHRDLLIRASAKRRDQVLTTLKEGEGIVFTLALADAIAKLPKDFQDKAREALAERLTRQDAKMLGPLLHDDDAEIRRAAIQACVIIGETSFMSDLSELLEDPNPAVAGLADDAIKTLSKSKKKPKADQASEVSASKNQSQGGDKDLKSLPQGN